MAERKKRVDVMIDIETLSTNREHGMIVEVGMVPFDINTDEAEKMDECLTFSVKTLESLLSGRIVDESTQNWWKGQSDESKRRLLRNEIAAVSIKDGFTELFNTLSAIDKENDLYVWSKGIDFDFPMIESTWKDLGIQGLPYKFWKKLDMRTVLNMATIMGWENTQKRSDIQHGAFEDCIDQINVLRSAVKYIKAGR